MLRIICWVMGCRIVGKVCTRCQAQEGLNPRLAWYYPVWAGRRMQEALRQYLAREWRCWQCGRWIVFGSVGGHWCSEACGDDRWHVDKGS